MGAACVTQSQKDQDEMGRMNMDPNSNDILNRKTFTKDDLKPTSAIQLLFEVMSFEIGYDVSALQLYCDKLQSLWIYRVIDVLNILNDEKTWKELEIPSVLEHVIRDYLNELSQTKTFESYSHQSHTDIYVTFINKDIRTLFKQLLKQVNNLEIAQKHLLYLENEFDEKYLLNIDKLKKYMTKEEWNELQVPTNLKHIICRKINLDFDGEDNEHIQNDKNLNQNQGQIAKPARPNSPKIAAVPDDSGDDDDEEEDDDEKYEQHDEGEEDQKALRTESGDDDIEIVLETPQDNNDSIRNGIHNMSRRISAKFQKISILRDRTGTNTTVNNDDDKEEDDNPAANNLHVFDENVTKDIKVRFNMMDIATWFSKELFVDDIERVYAHLSYFVEYGYYNLYHLSFISDEIFNKLLMITNTPKCLIFELYELLTIIRGKYEDPLNNIHNILPFKSNLYWEKLTIDAFKILQQDINLNLENECNILMNNFYSNIWDWQFITNDILKKLNAYQRYEIVRIRMQHIIKLCQYQYGQQNIPLLPPIWNSQYNSNLLLHQILLQQTNNNNNNPHILVYIFHFLGSIPK